MDAIYIFLIVCAVFAFGILVYLIRHRISKLMAKFGGIIELAQELHNYPSMNETTQNRIAPKLRQISNFVSKSKIAAHPTSMPIDQFIQKVEAGEEQILPKYVKRWARDLLFYTAKGTHYFHPDLSAEDRFLIILNINTWMRKLVDLSKDNSQKEELKQILPTLLSYPECTAIIVSGKEHEDTHGYTIKDLHDRVMSVIDDVPVLFEDGEEIPFYKFYQEATRGGIEIVQSEWARWIYSVLVSARINKIDYTIICSMIYYIDELTYKLSNPNNVNGLRQAMFDVLAYMNPDTHISVENRPQYALTA